MSAPVEALRAAALELAPVALSRPAQGPVHALTVDVEDWYQSCVDFDAPISDRVVRNTERLLELLETCGVKGTFFVQGLVAEAFPRLVRTLLEDGHDVQSHGHTHRPLSGMTHAQLHEEVRRGKAAVEDAGGVEVTAFRAGDFSIAASNLWALETLAASGFAVDSSVFPVKLSRYGIHGWPLEPQHVSGRGFRLVEIPVAVRRVAGRRIPVGGGGYLRVFPLSLTRSGIRALEDEGRPAVLYCHPYELAPGEPHDFPSVPARFRRLQDLGRQGFADRLRALLARHSFGTLEAVLEGWSSYGPVPPS